MQECNVKDHIFEKGGKTMVCSKCAKTFEVYREDLINHVETYRHNKRVEAHKALKHDPSEG